MGIVFGKNDNKSQCKREDVLDYSLLRGNTLVRDSTERLAMDSHPKTNFSDEKYDNINELELDREEQIELTYLLYPNCHDAYANMLAILEGCPENVIAQWIFYNKNNDKTNLFKHVVEALAVMQNYKALRQLGYTKDSLTNYLPCQKNISIHIDQHKKYFFRMFEEMDVSIETKFLDLVKEDMVVKNLDFKKFNCLELYFTYFETIKYIKRNDYSNILKHLKVLELDVFYEDIQKMQNTVEFKRTVQDNNRMSKQISETPSGSRRISETANRISSDNCYAMDPENPGVCLILDIEEFDGEYKGIALERREGSRYDSVRLESIFKKLRFTVFLYRNKTDVEIKDIISEVCNKIRIQDCSFFLFFLSHGDKGCVIASNGIALEIDDIKSWIGVSPMLKNKPKVLILQCCQGNNIHTDSGETVKNNGMDIIELVAALPGFASFRHCLSGSWMIQCLCDILEEHKEREHLLEICIEVQRRVRSKTWETEGEIRRMVCEFKSTFAKKLYLPTPAE